MQRSNRTASSVRDQVQVWCCIDLQNSSLVIFFPPTQARFSLFLHTLLILHSKVCVTTRISIQPWWNRGSPVIAVRKTVLHMSSHSHYNTATVCQYPESLNRVMVCILPKLQGFILCVCVCIIKDRQTVNQVGNIALDILCYRQSENATLCLHGFRSNGEQQTPRKGPHREQESNECFPLLQFHF